MDFKARIGLSLKDGDITKIKSDIEKKLKVNLEIGSSNNGGESAMVKSLGKELDVLISKVDKLKQTQRQQAKEDASAKASEISKLKQISDWQTKLSKMEVGNDNIFKGTTDSAKQAQDDFAKATQAVDAYNASATKMNKLTAQESFNNLSVSMKKATNEIKTTGSESFKLGEMMAVAGKKFLAWMSVTQVAMAVMNGIKAMANEVIALDASLIELQKVSNLTGSSLENFVDKAYESASELGRTGRELIDATTNFKRAGYDLSTSLELGKSALLMKNVGDGISDTAEASDILIASLKGFDLEASNAESIIDKMNQVSNNSSASFKDLSEGVKLVSQSFSSGGDSIDDMNGMLVAGNSSLRDMSRTANGLRTINLRLKGVSTDADDLAPSLTLLTQKFHDIANIDMMDSENQMRSMSSITDELNGKWDSLSKNQKFALAEVAGGKRQAEIFLSLMDNYDEKIKATNQSLNSFGSAQLENERYLGGIEAKQKAVTSAFSEFSKETLNSGVIKFFLDLTTNILKLTTSVGFFNVAIGVAFTAFLNLKKVPAIFTGIQTSINGFISKMAEATGISKGLMGGLTGLAISLSLIAIKGIADEIEKQTVTLEEQGVVVEDLKQKINSLVSEKDQLSKKANLTSGEEDRLNLLERQIELNKIILQQEEQKKFDKDYGQDLDFWEELKVKVMDTSNSTGAYVDSLKGIEAMSEGIRSSIEDSISQSEKEGNKSEAIQLRIEYTNKLRDAITELSNEQLNLDVSTEAGKEKFEESSETIEELSHVLDTQKNSLLEAESGLLAYKEAGVNAGDINFSNLINSIHGATDGLGEIVGESSNATDAINTLSNSSESLSNVYSNLKDASDMLSTAWNEQDSNGQLSIDTVMKLISAGGQYLDLLYEENGVYQLKAGTAEEMFEIQKALAIGEIQQQKEKTQAVILGLQAEISAFEASNNLTQSTTLATANTVEFMASVAEANITALGEMAGAVASASKKAGEKASNIVDQASYKKATTELAELQGSLAQYDKGMDVIASLTLPKMASASNKAGGATKGLGKEMSQAEKEADALKDTIESLKDTLADEKDELKEVEDAYKALQKAMEAQIDKELEMQEAKLKVIEAQKKEFEMMQKVAQEQIEKEIQGIQDKIDGLEKEEEEEDKILKIQEAQAEVEARRKALENAKNNKDTRVYTEGNGWEWQSNPKEVQDAEDSLSEALKKLIELQEEYEKAKIKADFQGQIDELKKLSDAWGQNMDDVNDDIRNHENVLEFLKKFQEANTAERLAMLEKFTADYNYHITKQNADTQSEIDQLKALKEQISKTMDIAEDLSKYAGAMEWLKNFENASYEERLKMLSNFSSSWKDYYGEQSAVIADLEADIKRLEGSLSSMKSNLDSASTSAQNASGSIGNAIDNSNTQVKKLINWEYDYEFNSENTDGKVTGGGKVFRTDANGNRVNVGNYASGGINEDGFGNQGIVDITGQMPVGGNNYNAVHGSASNPELILNAGQAVRAMWNMANTPVPNGSSITNNKNRNSKDIIIQSLVIQSNGQDLDKLLLQAQQRAITQSKR